MSDFISDIKENYLKMERELVTQLNYDVTNQHLIAGSYREEIWADFFRKIVPKKFNIARSVFIMDSNKKISKEVDIAIYDEQYTPYIFNRGIIKFIPVEAVAAVVQCKSRNLDSDVLKRWADSIDKLRTSNDSIVRLATNIHIGNESNRVTQTATKPIKILCYIPENKTEKDDTGGRSKFDIVIEAYKNNCSREYNAEENSSSGNLKITFSDETLREILFKYNRVGEKDEYENDSKYPEILRERKISDYEITDESVEYTLLSFIFQFNQMLMMINNPMFFPHKAYVNMLNK